MQIPMPLTWFVAFTSTIVLLSTFLIVTFMLTPAAQFLKARILNRAMVLLATRTGKLLHVTGKYKAGSATVETGDFGDYYMIPEAKYLSSGVVTAIAFEDYGISLPKDFIVASNVLDANNILPEEIIREGDIVDPGEFRGDN